MKRFFHDTITVEAVGIEQTAEGFLLIPARLTRVGILKYDYGNVMRTEWEVGDWKSIKTLEGKSVTNLHPEADIFIDPENWKQYEVGTTIKPYFEDNIVHATLIIKEKPSIDSILDKKSKGEVVEISCGYWADVIEYQENKTDEVTGELYRFEQKDIIYNHVALVPQGRAGANIKLMLDSIDNKPEENRMKVKVNKKEAAGKVILDAFEVVTTPENEKQFENMEKALDSACGEIDGLTEKLTAEKRKNEDSAVELETLKKTHVDMKEVEVLVTQKIELMKLCDALNVVTDGKSVTDLENEVIKVAMPKVILDGKSDDYRKAILDSSIEIAKEMGANNIVTRNGQVIDTKKEEPMGVFEKIEKGE